MKVKELIELLETCDQEIEIESWAEDTIVSVVYEAGVYYLIDINYGGENTND